LHERHSILGEKRKAAQKSPSARERCKFSGKPLYPAENGTAWARNR
jgi:hypothetical protein